MQVLCFLRSSRFVLKILKPIHVTEHSKLTQMPPDVCWVCFGKLLPYAQLCGAITVSKFRLFKWNTLGRISPHLTASTLTRLTAPQHLSPTQPSQAPNIKAWLLPPPIHAQRPGIRSYLSPAPKGLTDCRWTYSLSAKGLLFQRVLHDLAYGCFLITFPAFPLQVPAVFAPANSSAENTLCPDSHRSLPHFRGLPWTPNWKARPLLLHL